MKLDKPGLFSLIEPKNDSRGSFAKLFDSKITFLEKFKICEVISSINLIPGTIRGLHFQKFPHEIGKIVVCLEGEIFDVAVNIQKDSKNFGLVQTFELKSSDNKYIYIPIGFAHGFQTLVPNTKILYFLDNNYHSSHDSAISPFDSTLDIEWPISNYVVSERDKNAQTLEKVKNENL